MAYPQKSFVHTVVHGDSLIGRRREAVATNTLRYQLSVLKDTGRYDAFRLQYHHSYNDPPNVWPIPNHLFWDSDVAKWIEGACYFLRQQRDGEIECAIAELVDMIRDAQQPDGYINIHFTVVEPGKRFTNLRDFHELYNCGHLIEAALAHEDVFCNGQLLNPILKYVDLLCATFGKGVTQLPGYPGHPEIELALLRLHHQTGNPKHFGLAQFFLSERGNPQGLFGRHFYDVEVERRDDDPKKRPAFYPEARCLWYHQAHLPLVDQQSVEGHAVRAMYLLTAAADLVRFRPDSMDPRLEQAIFRLWDNMVDRKMYVTGGVGAMKQWEGFGLDYFLPQGTDEGGCYSETCAAIGVMMFAERLLQVKLDGRFTDIMELCLYNAVLTSMSHDGKKFTYVNQLASSDSDLSRREEWFTCACCPPNVMRLLGQIGGYISTFECSGPETASITMHLYISSTTTYEANGMPIVIEQKSDWPWSSDIKFSIKTSLRSLVMRLRIPGWAESFKISNGCPELSVKEGYVELPSEWLRSNPTFVLSIPLVARLIHSHLLTNQNTLSLARGPIVYCVEDVDNPWVTDHFKTVQLDPSCTINEREVYDKGSEDRFIALDVPEGASILKADNHSTPSVQRGAHSNAEPIKELIFIPYFFRNNREGRGQVRVGLRAGPCSGGRPGSRL